MQLIFPFETETDKKLGWRRLRRQRLDAVTSHVTPSMAIEPGPLPGGVATPWYRE